jgi:tRNA 2-thiouridine synthesizing protein B
MAALHLIYHGNALSACLRAAADDDALLLLHGGVYAAVAGAGRPVYVLEADVRARGLRERLAADATVIDDAGFVELAADCLPVVTWR